MAGKSINGVIRIRGAGEHNLQDVDLDLPQGGLIAMCGVSGSGKSSLAFDTLFAEARRRYLMSLGRSDRQLLQYVKAPRVQSLEGLSPAVAIGQLRGPQNPRSTVATLAGVYDYLRLLYARIGIPYSPATGKPITSQTVSEMVDKVLELPKDTKLYLMAPIARGQKGEFKKELKAMQKRGFTRVKIDGELHEMDDLPSIEKNKKHDIDVVVDRIKVSEELGNRLPDSIETCLGISDGLVHVEVVEIDESAEQKKGDIIVLSAKFACPESGFTLEEIEPRLFSFNSPFGACPSCDGLGVATYTDPSMVVPDPQLSLFDGAIAPWESAQSKYYMQTLDGLAKHYKFSLHVPWEDLPEKVQNIILHGTGEESIKINYHDGIRSFKSDKPFEGVIPNLNRRYRETDSSWVREEIAKFQSITDCPTCNGYRLKPEALCVKVGGLHIGEVCKYAIDHAVDWFNDLEKKLSKNHQKIAEKVLKEIRERLGFLNNVGLSYLTLSRESGTLSGGESQRIRLASQIGSGLSGVLYVLDEPSIGLHQCDNDRLLATLAHLRDLGNTVIVVEHDEDTMRRADHLIDIGPGAGIHGGQIISQGTPEHVANDETSITGHYLSGREQIDVPEERRQGYKTKRIRIENARENNLQGVSCDIPLGLFTCVTGVSGGGKSSLVIETLYKAVTKRLHGSKVTPGAHDAILGLEYIDKIIEIDQSPIGRTPRSNPATYTGAFGPIRDWFTGLPESKARGYKPGRFSFNVKGGRCEACQGDGMIKIEMHFLPDVYVLCDQCKGKRYNRETLEVEYKGKSIADVLNMTVEEAVDFFEAHPSIKEKMVALLEVGLGYIKLGQSATTLSGGEAQRIKLAKELSKRATGRTLYILDEPTTGLHSADIKKLLSVLHKLVDAGNSMVVIEHNLDVVKTADHVIDIGPGGGDKGGKLVATGTPEDIIKVKESITGQYLKPLLEKKKAIAAPKASKAPAKKKPAAKKDEKKKTKAA